MGDFEEALAALLGKDAVGLSASTVARLKDAWVEEHLRWSIARRECQSKSRRPNAVTGSRNHI